MKFLKKTGCTILATSLLLSSFLGSSLANTFSDVNSGDWHYAYVQKAVDMGAVAGYGDGSFRPNQGVTGYELWVMLANSFFSDRLEQQGTGVNSRGDDIPDWAVKYVYAVEGHGTTGGTQGYTSNLSAEITRDTAAQIIYGAMYNKGMDLSTLPDTVLGTSDSVKAVAHYGIMAGVSPTNFGSDTVLTRAQAAVVLDKLAQVGEMYGTGTASDTVITGTTNKPSTTTITEAEAKAIALTHAGLTESAVTFLQCKLDWDDGVQEYDVEFYVGNMEYDYEIDATTGAIRSFDQETETSRPSTGTTSTPSTTTIAEAEAKAIALAHAGLTESAVTFLQCKLDWDDGVQEYDVEFYVGNMEYDYEIDATTGAIRSFDQETETSRPSTGTTSTPSTTTIAEAEAKAIALAHAGLTESAVTFLQCKLDWDDGVQEYDVEFYVGNMEYDYEIDATTGAIRSFDQETEISRPSTGTTSTPSTTTITEAEAKAIALTHAGLTESGVTRLKCSFEYDDGRPEYEIEWSVGNWEYEVTVHGSTGAILEYDKDND